MAKEVKEVKVEIMTMTTIISSTETNAMIVLNKIDNNYDLFAYKKIDIILVKGCGMGE